MGLQTVHADGIHESAWVKDNAQVLNQSTINQVNQINTTKLKQVKGHPQLAVITIAGLPKGEASIEDYAHDQMKKLRIGRQGWNNGMLLVINTKDHVNRLEVGTGLEAALPDGAKANLVTSQIQQAFKQQDYNTGVSELTDNIANYLQAHQDNILTPSGVKDSQSNPTPGVNSHSVVADMQRNQANVAFIIFLLVVCGMIGFLMYKFVIPKLRNRDQVTLAKQRFAQNGINDPQLLNQLDQFVTDELRHQHSFNVHKLSNPEWWYLLNALNLKQPISLEQDVKLEIKKGNPLYQTHLITSQALANYQTQLKQRQQANLQVVSNAAHNYALQHHFPGNIDQFTHDATRQIAMLTWFGLPSNDAEFQSRLANALELISADATLHYQIDNDADLRAKMRQAGIHNPDQYINDLSDEQKKRFVTNGLVNTAILFAAIGLIHNNHNWHDDNFPPMGGGFGGDSGFDASDFGSGFGGSGDDDGGGFNF
ncbi:TPM domain-containing protein [Fructilactobacillus sp. Tb1]|uniref:TPM domain-containing protein n=1 Tax=Fructilactobacillus sp. Tb1 TaxID=3422304 RepID=UPI003D27053F